MFFWTMIVCILILSTCASFWQTALYGLLTTFPPKFTQAFVTGQGLAGCIVAVSNFIIAWSQGAPDKQSIKKTMSNMDREAILYFSVGWCLIAISYLSWTRFLKMNVVQSYLMKGKESSVSLLATTYDEVNCEVYGLLNNQQDIEKTQEVVPTAPSTTLWKRVQGYIVTEFLVFGLTLTIFPALIASLRSTSSSSSRLFHDLWIPLLYVLFNVGDFLGRCSSNIGTRSGSHLATLSLLRWIFVPLFSLCQLHKTPSFFDNDLYPLLFIALVSWSNGYLSSVAFMAFPSKVPSKDQPKAANWMFLALCTGLTTGSFLSFGLHTLLFPNANFQFIQ